MPTPTDPTPETMDALANRVVAGNPSNWSKTETLLARAYRDEHTGRVRAEGERDAAEQHVRIKQDALDSEHAARLAAEARIATLEGALRSCRRRHTDICLAVQARPDNPPEGSCWCGADAHNAAIDAALAVPGRTA